MRRSIATRPKLLWAQWVALSPLIFYPLRVFSAEAPGSLNQELAIELSLPRESLDAALQTLGRASGMQIAAVVDAQPNQLLVGPLYGHYTIGTALQLLLAGTGLTYRFANQRTIAIVPASSALTRAPIAKESRNPERAASCTEPGNGVPNCIETSQALPEVLITSERRLQSIQMTPIAATALSGAELRDANVTTISDLQAAVPGVVVNDIGGLYEFINIRGVGNATTNPAVSTGVAVYRDGFLMPETIGQDVPLFDVKDMEILRGPQGTFVGANSTGGAIEINSEDPDDGGLQGYAQASLGNYGNQQLDAALTLPPVGSLFTRLAVAGEQRESFFSSVGADAPNRPGHFSSEDARLTVVWIPSSSAKLRVKIQHDRNATGGEPGQPNPNEFTTLFNNGGNNNEPLCTYTPAGSLSCPAPGALSHSMYFAYSSGSPFTLNYINKTAYDQSQTRATAELEGALANGIIIRDIAGLVSEADTHIVDISFDAANAGVAYSHVPSDLYYGEELNVISPTAGKVNWIVGGFWFYRRTPLVSHQFLVSPPYEFSESPSNEMVTSFASTERAAAIFVQVNAHLTHQLELQAGLRDNWDTNFVSNLEANGIYSVGSPPTLVSPINEAGRFSDNIPTFKLSLNWTPSDRDFAYVFYAKGYKTGGINPISISTPTYEPERVDDFEMGWKRRWLNGALQTELDAYYMNYENLQFPVFDTSTANSDKVVNLAPSSMGGLEGSLQFAMNPWNAAMGLSYNHSELGALSAVPSYRLPGGFNGPTYHPQCQSVPQRGCFNYLPYIQDVQGERAPFSPRFTANASLGYSERVGPVVVHPQLRFTHVDKQYGSIWQGGGYFLLAERNLWDLDIHVTNGPWDLDFYGMNLTNDLYVVGLQGSQIYYGSPRQYGTRLKVSF